MLFDFLKDMAVRYYCKLYSSFQASAPGFPNGMEFVFNLLLTHFSHKYLTHMQNKVEREGQYELFLTTNDNTILTLDESLWFAIAEGQQGDIIVKSNSDHSKKETLQKGRYYLVDFNDDPVFRDMPHLFLENESDHFDEWILPKGLPSRRDKQVKLVKASHTITGSKLKSHLERKSQGTGRRELEKKSRSSIYQIAKEKKIKGRSRMTKDELIDALTG
jgi:hypothetical protein